MAVRGDEVAGSIEAHVRDAMEKLIAVGVPSGAVFDTMELLNEPTFEERGIMQVVHHRQGGERDDEDRPHDRAAFAEIVNKEILIESGFRNRRTRSGRRADARCRRSACRCRRG